MNKKFILSPLVILISIWGMVLYLYGLGISNQFLFSYEKLFDVLKWIFIPFLLFYFFTSLIIFSTNKFVVQTTIPEPLILQKRTLLKLFYFWSIVTIFEIGISGGMPIFWYLLGINKTYFDFGIGGLHGLMNAFLLTISSFSFITYMKTGEKFYILFSMFIILWGILAIARQLVVVYLIQILFIYAFMVSTKELIKKIGIIFVFSIVFIIGFGLIGDLRNGREVIIGISSLLVEYPDWMPSGFLWVYMYLVTPVNNLVNAFVNYDPHMDFMFPKTLSALFPSFIRELLFGPAGAFERPWLYVKSFTVSTAFINPYIDFGKLGVFIFSSLIGIFSSIFRNSKSEGFIFTNAVFLQCIFLSIFVNHFLYLPVIFQLFISYFLIRKYRT